jgi:hypothetical protein
MFLTKMSVASLILNVLHDPCQNFCLATEIRYLGRNGKASWLISFAGKDERI